MGETLDINLPSEGRIGVLGQNESGKTTFFQAIEIALFGLRRGSGPDVDRKNLVTWGKDQARLEIEFSSGQNRYYLQRTFNPKNIHKAKLMSIINGEIDKSSAITGLTAIERNIEDITGMDRDSFTKLVYIKQKDLDALKELAKSKRKQLVNKVMGIEIFDNASDEVKKEVSLRTNELENMEIKFENVKKNKENYEFKLNQKSKLQNKIKEEEPRLVAKKKKLDISKTSVAKYEWISNYNSAKELECSLKAQFRQVENDLNKISEMEDQIIKLQKTLDVFKPEIKDFEYQYQELHELERRFTDEENSFEMLKVKKQEKIRKLGLVDRDLELLSQDLSKQKSQSLLVSGVTAIGGLIFVILAFLFTFIIFGAAIILFSTTIYFMNNYLKLDRLATKNVEIGAVNIQLNDQEKKVSNIEVEKEKFISKIFFKTSQEIKEKLDMILSQMEKEIGEKTIAGTETLLRSKKNNLSKLKETNPQNIKEKLGNQIKINQAEIQDLENRKPDSTDELKYTKEEHESLKKDCDIIQNEWNNIKEDIDHNRGILKQLEDDLLRLEPDFELFPQIKKDVDKVRENIKILNLVKFHLSETSKELRNKVLPHARLIINQILPTLTSDRYSDFEITEDLKFKVHSNQAGGYKEREIFSGGTQDQFLIALRLAFTQSILDSRVQADKYSLLMDECTSSSDVIRKQGIFQVLDAMKQTFSQIFIIAHEDIANYVDHHIVFERNNNGFTKIRSKSWI
jgi:exonuclease SbcC